MKVLHLQGANWALMLADALLALGLIGLAFKTWSSSGPNLAKTANTSLLTIAD